MKKNVVLFFLIQLAMLIYSSNSMADCSSLFTQALQTHSTPILDPGNFQYNLNGAANTYSSGTTNLPAGDYRRTVVRGSSTVLNFTTQNGIYRIKKLIIKKNATVNFAPGTYWIEDIAITTGTIQVSGTGTVRLMILNASTLADAVINSDAGSDASKLFIYGYSDLTLNSSGTFKGFIYSEGTVTFDAITSATGAINAQNITMGSGVVMNYDAAAVTTLNNNNVCTFPSTITHFKIDPVGVGYNGTPTPITVKAFNNETLVTNFYGTIVIDTNSGLGDWSLSSGNGVLDNATANDGIAYYDFSPLDNGQVTFLLTYPESTDSINIDVELLYDDNITDDDTEGKLTFANSTFVLTDAALPSTLPDIEDIALYSTTQTAGITTPIYITAIRKVGASWVKDTTYAGSKRLRFKQTYLNPTSGTLVTTINGTEIGAGTFVRVDVDFTNGEAMVNSLYRDVGMIKLNVKDATTTPDIIGNTEPYVIKPAKLAITNVLNNPAATDANGGIFTTAGEPFTVEVTVQDNDNNSTPNFGNELIPEGIKLTSTTLVAPSGGRNGSNNDGAIGNNNAFSSISPGVFQGDLFYFDEVGIIKLTASINSGNYLDAGDVSGPESGNVGRFTPHHFAASLNTPIFNSGCPSGGFTYLDQPFTYNVYPLISVEAQSLFNTTTQNYQGSFWKMGTNNIAVVYTSNSPTSTLESTNAALDISVSNTNDGLGSIQLGDDGDIHFERAQGSNIEPFDVEMQSSVTIQDSDNITYSSNPFIIGGTTAGTGIAFTGGNSFRQGRVNLDNASNSGLEPLNIPVKMEYFNNSNYVINTADNCTIFADPNNIDLAKNPASLNTTPSFGTVSEGVGSIILSPPNGSGYADVSLDLSGSGENMPYLQYDWPTDVDSLYDDNPYARATFGVYTGPESLIYKQEVLD